MKEQSRVVSAIEKGTVIDHIPSDATLKVMHILKLDGVDEIVSVAFNLKSKLMKTKGVIKIGGKYLNSKEINRIALIAPQSTLSKIENYKVIEKTKLEIPDDIIGVAKCINPNCITNNEKMRTSFHVEDRNPVKVRCEYCERTMTRKELIIK